MHGQTLPQAPSNPFPSPPVQKGRMGPKLCLSHTFTRVLGAHWKIPVQGAFQLCPAFPGESPTSPREGACVPHNKGQHFPLPMYFPISLPTSQRPRSPPKPSSPHSHFAAIAPPPFHSKSPGASREPAGMQGTQGQQGRAPGSIPEHPAASKTTARPSHPRGPRSMVLPGMGTAIPSQGLARGHPDIPNSSGAGGSSSGWWWEYWEKTLGTPGKTPRNTGQTRRLSRHGGSRREAAAPGAPPPSLPPSLISCLAHSHYPDFTVRPKILQAHAAAPLGNFGFSSREASPTSGTAGTPSGKAFPPSTGATSRPLGVF